MVRAQPSVVLGGCVMVLELEDELDGAAVDVVWIGSADDVGAADDDVDVDDVDVVVVWHHGKREVAVGTQRKARSSSSPKYNTSSKSLFLGLVMGHE